MPRRPHAANDTQLIRSGDSQIQVEIYSRTRVAESSADTPRLRLNNRRAKILRTRTDPGPPPGQQCRRPIFMPARQSRPTPWSNVRGLKRIVRLADGFRETEISIPDEAPRHPGIGLHPVVLDAALQSVGAAIPDGIAGSAEASYLPVSFETIRVYCDIGRHVRCRAHLTNLDGGTGRWAGSS